MTYKELLDELSQLPKERLEDTATIFDPYTDEYTAIEHSRVAEKEWDEGVLDEGHYYLVMKA